MKEASGEANKTVITIVLIGVVAAVGLILVPRLIRRAKSRSCCHELGGRLSICDSHNEDHIGKWCCWWSGDIDSNGLRSSFIQCTEEAT